MICHRPTTTAAVRIMHISQVYFNGETDRKLNSFHAEKAPPIFSLNCLICKNASVFGGNVVTAIWQCKITIIKLVNYVFWYNWNN